MKCYLCKKTGEQNAKEIGDWLETLPFCQDCGEDYCDACFHKPEHDLCGATKCSRCGLSIHHSKGKNMTYWYHDTPSECEAMP